MATVCNELIRWRVTVEDILTYQRLGAFHGLMGCDQPHLILFENEDDSIARLPRERNVASTRRVTQDAHGEGDFFPMAYSFSERASEERGDPQYVRGPSCAAGAETAAGLIRSRYYRTRWYSAG